MDKAFGAAKNQQIRQWHHCRIYVLLHFYAEKFLFAFSVAKHPHKIFALGVYSGQSLYS